LTTSEERKINGVAGHAPREASRADQLLSSELPAVARAHIRLARKTFEPGMVDRGLRIAQKLVGASWIDACTRNLRRVHGFDRVGAFDPAKSYVCVANHRSFFDLYVVTAYLVKHGLLPHRLLFPVRSTFFYESAAGMVVNGAMSFFAMYPPLFRERRLAHLNVASLDEIGRLLSGPGVFVGLHPEGTRGKDDDPYALLPARSGVGRIIHQSGATVIPVFINGLGNGLAKQVAGNFTGKGEPINVVFGAPVDFGELRDRPASPRVFKQVSECSLEAVRMLGEEERAFRAQAT
jgi:1-acyl-sn-glycerol-3-phosphate acyltransferase